MRPYQFRAILLLLLFSAMILTIPLVVYQLRTQQETRSRAGVGDAVSFYVRPQEETKSPNQTFEVDLWLDSKNQPLSGVDVTVAIENRDIIELVSFNRSRGGPGVLDTELIGSQNGISDQGRVFRHVVVQKNNTVNQGDQIKFGTLTLRAKTIGSTRITLQRAQVTGIGQQQTSGIPVTGTGSTLGTYTVVPPPTVTPIGPPAPTLPPGTTPTPTPVPDRVLSLRLVLQGIGGDGATPRERGGNANPLNRFKNVQALLFDQNDSPVTTASPLTTRLTFNRNDGHFHGVINLTSVPQGTYKVKLKSNKYLMREVPESLSVPRGLGITIDLLTGDIALQDNKVDAADYNAFFACFGTRPVSPSCPDKSVADVNDDGGVDIVDGNFIVGNLGRRGD